MTLRRCDGTDTGSTRTVGVDEPLTVRSAANEIRSRVPGGDLAAALDAQPFDKNGFREISFKLGGDLTARHEDRRRVVISEGTDYRVVACDCGRVYDDEQFKTDYPHDPLRPDPYDIPVVEHDEAEGDRVDREARELAERRRIAREVD